jgi:short-subunit dehydrogenase
MADLLGKWCVVTGAASGIGRATATALQAEGARLVLCDIREEELQKVAQHLRTSGEVLSYGVDVALLPQVARFSNFIREQIGVVDVLVNNAGILKTGGYEETPFETWHQVMDVNFWGALHATKLLVPPMVERGSGTVINVASASGIVGFSKLTAYSASKFALVGFSEALRAELATTGVKVSTICPGLVRTEIAKNSDLPPEEVREIEDILERRGVAPEKVAQAIVGAAIKGTPLVHVGTDAKLLSAASRVFPASASRWLAKVASREG